MKTTLIKTAIFVSIFFITHLCFAESDLNSAFNNYQKSYQSGDFEAAKNIIEEALKSHTHNSYLIYNLGLTEYKLGKVGLALGLWRKALLLNPRLNEARSALNYAIGQMSAKPLTKNTDSTWVWLEKLIVDNLSFNIVFPLFLICFFVFGLQIIKYWGAKKKAFDSDEDSPLLGARPIIMSCLAFIFAVFSFVTFKDLSTSKATVISQNANIKTGPNSENATLFEVPEGTELLIRDKDNQWYKIEDPAGRIGWADASQIFITTDVGTENIL